MVTGLARAGHVAAIPAALRRVPEPNERLESYEIFVREPVSLGLAESVLDAFSGADRQRALATLVESRRSVDDRPRIEALLGRITDAAYRSTAVAAVAKLLAASGQRAEAVSLLEAELKALPARKRGGIDGHAVHYVRIADAFLAAGEPKRGEAILRFAEGVRAERRAGVTYEDSSGPERALLWARLGAADAAVARATEKPAAQEGYGGLLGRVVVLLARAGKRAEALAALSAAHASAYAQFMVELALFDEEQARMSVSERFRVLDGLTARARTVKDPASRSEKLGHVALRWAAIANIRRALLVSSECFPVDRAIVLNQLLAQTAPPGRLEFGQAL
jgi:tetratricopeptide (TPR) repeat protein